MHACLLVASQIFLKNLSAHAPSAHLSHHFSLFNGHPSDPSPSSFVEFDIDMEANGNRNVDEHDDDDQDELHDEAACGSTSWKVMDRTSKKNSSTYGRSASDVATKDNNDASKQPPLPTHPSAYVTPHAQSGPIATPSVPKPPYGSNRYQPSPATATRLKQVMPAPPFATVDGTMAPHASERKEDSEALQASDEQAQKEDDVSADVTAESLKKEAAAAAASSCTSASASPASINPKVYHVSDSLEDELLDAAASGVADICSDEVADHTRRKSEDDTNPAGAHNSLENLLSNMAVADGKDDGTNTKKKKEEEKGEDDDGG